MQGIAELVVKVTDLLEAEGRSARSALRDDARQLREAGSQFAVGLVVCVAGGVLATVGVLLWLAAAYLAISEAATPAWGAVGAGVLAVLMGIGGIIAFRKMVSS